MPLELLPLPSEIVPALNKGAKVRYSFFANATDDFPCLREAIAQHIGSLGFPGGWQPSLDRAFLDQMVGMSIDRLNFLGEWYDPDRDGLILRGSGEIEGLGRRTNPRYDELEGRRFPGGWSLEYPSHDIGNYAYAFSQPPLGLLSGYAETEELFRSINAIILPSGERQIIRSWRGYDLTRLSDYFNAGAEYWGTFLFTLLNEASGRLVVISASASD